jgi:hypothetical protein
VRKVWLPLVLFALLVASCSSPTDKPALRWVEFLETQTELVKAGKFDTAAFERDGTAIVEQLSHHRDAKTGQLLMSAEVLEKFRAANTAFSEACDAAQNKQALEAFDRVAAPLLQPREE